jgi:hypothetical protein
MPAFEKNSPPSYNLHVSWLFVLMSREPRVPSSTVLSQPWPSVRLALVKHCGVTRASKRGTTEDDPHTRHCFADGNHVECCVPSNKSDYENNNREGRAKGISRNNALPLCAYNGRWCTCVSGNVCRQQFNTEAQWTAVWVGRWLCIAVRGHPRVVGSPTGRLPSGTDRKATLLSYERLHPGFHARAKAFLRTNTPTMKRRRVTTKPRTSRTTKLPLCTSIDPDLKRGPDHPHADLQCLSPSGKPMAYPRKHSYRECQTYRRKGHKGSTVRASCSAFFS